MNLREQFNADTKGYASFQEYCRAEVDKKPASMPQAIAQQEPTATLYIRGRYPAWRIDARGTLAEMLDKGEQRSLKKIRELYRYGVKVVDSNGATVKQWEKNRI